MFGSEYWQPLIGYFKDTLYEQAKTIDDSDLKLFVVTDDPDEVVGIIKNYQPQKMEDDLPV